MTTHDFTLEPCPHCGGKAKIESIPGTWEGYGLKKVYCTQCSASAALKDWNNRYYQINIETKGEV